MLSLSFPSGWDAAIHYKVREWSLPEQGRLHAAGAESGRQKKFWVCIRRKAAPTSASSAY
ncbi:hypothetical protein KCP73_26015 [Salmonella enterica subsp. enterica]|nr:hypothetical protein KCP73_26015 [Salmonella enterica subsp. enterica]